MKVRKEVTDLMNRLRREAEPCVETDNSIEEEYLINEYATNRAVQMYVDKKYRDKRAIIREAIVQFKIIVSKIRIRSKVILNRCFYLIEV